MIPGDRLLCAFIDPFETGYTFTQWPLHITLIPWFRTGAPIEELAEAFGKSLRSIGSFIVIVDDEAGFGYRRRKLVNLVRTPSPLKTIEQRARVLLHTHNAWIVDETTKVQRDFVPHITALQSGRMHTGDTFVCDTLYIVEQKGEYREIVSRIKL